jgi:bacterioferritin-associated ferredoxin
MPIDRCVCTGVSFAGLAGIARREKLSLEMLGRRTGAGEGCGTCRPYLRRMLRTGQCVFYEPLNDADEPDVQSDDSKA